MKAMIFAAGLGTRLKPVTDTIPKALVPVGGEPMLWRTISKLRDAGISEIIVNAHHFREKVVESIQSRDFGIDVRVSLEEGPEPLETGGGVRHAAKLLAEGGSGRFLVHNADILSDLDMGWFLSRDDEGSLATLLVVDRESDRYLLFDEGMNLVGWTNVRTSEVKSPYKDLDPSSCRRLSFCGIHVISESVFGLMEDWPERFGIIDFYLSVCDRHRIKGVLASNLDIIDIGTPASLEEAERKILTIGKKY